jgi:hypothetical protein
MMITQPRQWTIEELELLINYLLRRATRFENAFAGLAKEGFWQYIPWSTRHMIKVQIEMARLNRASSSASNPHMEITI